MNTAHGVKTSAPGVKTTASGVKTTDPGVDTTNLLTQNYCLSESFFGVGDAAGSCTNLSHKKQRNRPIEYTIMCLSLDFFYPVLCPFRIYKGDILDFGEQQHLI